MNVADETPVAFAYEERGQLYYTTVGEIRRKPANTYTHRNGETETPDRPGWYWIHGEVDSPIVHIHGGPYGMRAWNSATESYILAEHLVGRWWGPIVPPWQSED